MLTACSQRDKAVDVKQDDPEMVAAIAKARELLPQFWQIFESQEGGESDFALKVRITDSRGTEHFWVTDIERRDGITKGIINNDPNIVKSVKLGDQIVIPEEDITDWLYMQDGKMVGNETLRPLLKRVPAEEAEALRQLLADP